MQHTRRNHKGQFARKAFNTLFYFLVTLALFGSLMFVGTRNSEAEYHHCMVTMVDKSICETAKP